MGDTSSFFVIAMASAILLSGSVNASNELAQDEPLDSPTRESSVTAAFDRNPGPLNSFSLGTNIAFAESPRFLMDYKRDGLPRLNSGESSAKSLSLGGGWDFNKKWSVAIRGDYQSLPESVNARGIELRGRYHTGDWKFGLGLNTLRYNREVTQRSTTADLAYNFSKDWNAHFSGTDYRYGGATPSQLQAILLDRPTLSTGLIDAVSGFPSRSGTIGADYQLNEKWDVDLSFSRTTYELAPRATNATLAVNYQAGRHWEFGVSGARLWQDRLKSGSVLGIVATYAW